MEKDLQIKIGDILEGKMSFNASGSAYLVSTELPKDIYISKANTKKAFHLDNVKIKVIKGNGRNLEGIVTEIINRFREEFVGTIQIADTHAFFIPDSNKIPTDFYIPLDKLTDAKDGQKVIVRLTEWKEKARNPNGEVLRVLGDSGEHETEINAIMEEYGLPYEFPEEVLAEARAISTEIPIAEINRRRDMRNILTFTIDPADAKDFDDALSVEWHDGQLEVGIHIADVSHYLRPDTELDKEAFRRGTSVYLVDRCVPMLPEILSNELCSLKPHEDKLCFSAIFKLDNKGKVIEEWFGKTIINSDHRYTYEEAQDIIENKNGTTADSILEGKLGSAILALNRYAQMMRSERSRRGSISFEKHEVKFKLDAENKPTDIVFKLAKDSNKLIEEFMLLANRHVAQHINEKGWPNINRAHDKPNEAKLEALKEFIKQFGYELRTDTPEDTTRSLNKLLIDVRGTAEEDMINNLVVRTMQKANYATKNIGHYGLGFRHYSHFTSPIRRYPDVILHRLLQLYLATPKHMPKVEKLEGKCIHLSERETKAQKAERDSIKYMQCIYMSERVGKVFKGIVSSVSDFGIFVEILENRCDGFIKISDISGDTYQADTNNHCVKGHRTGNKIRLGDIVDVVVSSVDVERKNINLSIIRL